MPETFKPSSEEHLTEDQLKWGYWWVTHQLEVRRWLTVVLGIIAISLFGYGAWGYLDWFFGSGVPERANLAQLSQTITNYQALNQAAQPSEIGLGAVQILAAGAGAYDFVAEIANDNARWWAEYEYQFFADGTPLGQARADFILPASTKRLHYLGWRGEGRPGAVEVKFIRFQWHRVDLHLTRPDYPTWAQARLNILIKDIGFKPASAAEQLSVSRALFTVKNDTGFSYRQAGFFVGLYGGSSLVGANYLVISNLRAGEVRPVEASWFADLPRVTRVEVFPDVNIFDSAIYLEPGR